MKKNIRIVLSAVLVLAIAALAVGCSGNGITEETALAIQDKYTAVANTIAELSELAATYGIDETNAANLNAAKDAVEQVGITISENLAKCSEKDGLALIEQIDQLQETLNGYYSLYQ